MDGETGVRQQRARDCQGLLTATRGWREAGGRRSLTAPRPPSPANASLAASGLQDSKRVISDVGGPQFVGLCYRCQYLTFSLAIVLLICISLITLAILFIYLLGILCRCLLNLLAMFVNGFYGFFPCCFLRVVTYSG